MHTHEQRSGPHTGGPDPSPRVFGTFQVKVLDEQAKARDDPFARSYVSAPSDTRVERTWPLHDFRPHAFGSEGWSWARSAALLSRYGFTAVKFAPDKCTPGGEQAVRTQDWDDLDALERDYFPEVRHAVAALTGAKQVFITNSIVRTGDLAGIDGADKGAAPPPAHAKDDHKAVHETRPTHIKSSDQAKPSRVPHMDYTPLGARTSIRCWRPDIRAAAVDSGVIAAEDDLCAEHHVDPQDAGSNDVVNAYYNQGDGRLGPRYAAYSVWRPLRTVTRDPLAMAPRRTFDASEDLMFDTYRLRVLAAPSMQGDFLRELEALATTKGHAAQNADRSTASEPQWHYISDQKPDEVIVLKFFDSAALGDGEQRGEASSVPHASPDIGSAAHGAARESIEVRCIAFW